MCDDDQFRRTLFVYGVNDDHIVEVVSAGGPSSGVVWLFLSVAVMDDDGYATEEISVPLKPSVGKKIISMIGEGTAYVRRENKERRTQRD